MERIKKPVLLTLGWISFALGAIGAVLPVMPTTPFLLLAAYFFSKGSPRLYKWLVNLPHFGQPLRDYTEHGVVSKKGKIGCTVAVFLVLVYFHFLLKIPVWAKVSASCVLIAVVVYVITRPSSSKK